MYSNCIFQLSKDEYKFTEYVRSKFVRLQFEDKIVCFRKNLICEHEDRSDGWCSEVIEMDMNYIYEEREKVQVNSEKCVRQF